MADFEVNDIASIGLIKDVKPYQLPPEAWSLALNVRIRNDSVERGPGWTQVFGTLTGDPRFVLPVRTAAGEVWWVYADLDAVYVYDGTNEYDISGVSAPYSAANGRDWNGTWLGGIPILNNGADAPQFWSALDTGTALADLSNWPATLTARVVRAFGPNLVALNLVESGSAYPHAVQWSHPADPGSVPVSWDITDETHDAGRTDLPDTESGILLDGLPLRGQMVLYKENSTWLMRRIGGAFIFQFDQFLVASGLLAPRCVALTGDGKRHFVVTQDDIVVHDGTTVESILEKRMRQTLFNRIDATNYRESFVFVNPAFREMWFCYPDSGSAIASRALVWQYGNGNEIGKFSEMEIPFQCAANGDVPTLSGDVWDSDSDVWDSDITTWDSSDRRKTIIGTPSAGELYQLDSGLTRDGAEFTATVQREGLAVIGRRRSGEPIVDFKSMKQVNRVWVKAEGGPLNVRVGFQQTVDGSISWSVTQSFDPATQMYVDVVGIGRAIAIEFSTTASVAWKVFGYTVEIISRGRF